MKLLTKYYDKNLPDIGDIVFGKVQNYTEYGINIHLPEYNILAYLNFKNASMAKKLKKIKKQLKVGTEHFFGVIMVDSDKNYVDLDKKYQSNNDDDCLLLNYKNYKTCLNIMSKFFKMISVDSIGDQETYMREMIWNIDKDEVFKKFDKYRENIDNINIKVLNSNQKTIFYKCLCESIKEKIYTVRYHIKINCLEINGCTHIKNYLEGLKNKYNSNPYVISAPIYGIDINNVKLNDINLTKEEFNKYIDYSKSKKILVQISSHELIN